MRPGFHSTHLLSVAAALLGSAPAHAHIEIMSPAPRYSEQKDGPCGRGAADARTENVSVFEPGTTITLTWRETIGHPGHYRVSFDADGQDAFQDPASYTDFFTNDAVLLDDIPDETGTGVYSVDVPLPNVECENCTLQLIQMMTDKPPYTVGGNDLYFQCVDLILRRGDGSGCSAAGGTPVAMSWLLLLALVLGGRRARRRA